MLHEGDRLIKPLDIKDQVPWDKIEGVVILCLNKKNEVNQLFMSSVTVEEIAYMSKQLDSHVTCLLGPMKEG